MLFFSQNKHFILKKSAFCILLDSEVLLSFEFSTLFYFHLICMQCMWRRSTIFFFLFADSEDRIIVSVKIRIWLFCICTRSDCEFSFGTKKLLKNSSKMLWCGGPMKGFFPLSKISKWYLLIMSYVLVIHICALEVRTLEGHSVFFFCFQHYILKVLE